MEEIERPSEAAFPVRLSGPVSKYTGQVPAALDAIPAAVRAEARERRRFLALVDMTASSQRIAAKVAVALVAAAHADEFPLLLNGGQGRKSQLTYSNYRNWRQILLTARKSGAVDDETETRLLARRYARGQRGSTGDPRFLELFRKLYLNRNKLSFAAAYRSACDAWPKIDRTVPAPGIAVCRYHIRQIPAEVVVRAREGETAWRNKCCDYITRDWSDIAPGDLAVGDSRPFDTRVRVWNEKTGKWDGARPTVAALMDARSWKMVAYWITTDPVNTDTLINTLALWCRNTDGVPPAMCYFDNGKDYNAAGFSTPLEVKGGHTHSIFQELGIKLVNATPYNARAKTVEREFQDMMSNFDKLFLDYLGSKPTDRSDASSWYDEHPEELPSAAAFCKVFDAWLERYHATPKHGRIHRGKSPDQIWAERTADQARRRTDAELAEALLRPVGLRLIGRGPAIQYGGDFYITDDVGWGETVLVKRSSWDPTFLALYTPDGRRRGIARTREAIKAIAAGTEDETALAALIRRQSTQNKAARTMLHDLTGGTYGAAPLEILLTAGTDAAFQSGGTMRLVKGGTHRFKVVEAGGVKALESAENAEEPAARGKEACANLTEQERQDAEEIAAVLQRNAPESEPGNEENEEDLSDIYNFTHNNKGEEDDGL